MISVKTFTVNMFQENTFLIFDTVSKAAILVDPGFYTSAEKSAASEFVEKAKLIVQAIWLTHSHIDHVLGLAWAVSTYKCPYYQSVEDRSNLLAVQAYAGPAYGISNFVAPDAEPVFIGEGDTLKLGEHSFSALDTPGHAGGHLSFYNQDLGLLAGDVLFNGSIGRTDLPGGDFGLLEKSIKEKVYTLPDNTIVFPGHGPTTTVGHEKRFNPFVRH